MYGVLLIIVLVITGGAIAFIGDRLGTKIGKKKLTVFGLRPRYTSILVTIVTGFAITALTLGVMTVASQEVRTALFGMEKLRSTINQIEGELQQAQDALTAAQADVARITGERALLEEETDKLRLSSAELTDKNAALLAENGFLLLTNDSLQGENAELTRGKIDLEAQTAALRRGIVTLREDNIIYRAGEIIASGVVSGGGTSEEILQVINGIAQLAVRNFSLRSGENRTDQDLWIYRPELDAAVAAIEESPAGSEIIVRMVATGNLVNSDEIRASIELYPNSTIYRDNELIIARVYNLDEGAPDPEGLVMSFLSEVNKAASDKGVLPDPIRGTIGVIEGSEFYGLVGYIAQSHGTIVLSAYARNDTDAMGPLRLNFKVESIDPTSS